MLDLYMILFTVDSNSYLFTDIISGKPDEVEDNVYIPLVVRSVLLCQYCDLEDLDTQVLERILCQFCDLLGHMRS